METKAPRYRVPTGDVDARVGGFEVTDAELADADEFEKPFAYKRIAVKLASGRDAFVYVFCPIDVPTTIR